MPMHMGIPPLGIPTLEEAGCREAEAWDEMFDAMLDEHLERHLEGLEEPGAVLGAPAPASYRKAAHMLVCRRSVP